jgi:hypothetical protein
VHPLIGNLCALPEGGVSVEMYRALCSDLSLDDALDLAEIDEVARSWRAAAHANMDDKRKRESSRRGGRR